MSFTLYKQTDTMDCGPTCLRMISKYYGRKISTKKIVELSETTREGSSLLGLSYAAEKIGFRTLGAKININDLKEKAPLPCICFWEEKHFVVVYKIKNRKIYVADPGLGKIIYNENDFTNGWIGENNKEFKKEGVVLLLEPTPLITDFEENDLETKNQKGFKFLFNYLLKYKKSLVQIAIGLLATSLLQLVLPFLTQSIVDVGIQNQDYNFLFLILIGQIFVVLGRFSVEIVRSWVLLHLSTRINISLVSDFLIKLMKLPISYFDNKMTGDLLQRINDHKRIQDLLTNQSLSVLFSVFNFIVFSSVLITYNSSIFLIFLLGSIFYFIWIRIFMKKRKILDYQRFSKESEERSKLIELIQGMQDIKLNNAEKIKRWGWERIQIQLFKLQIKSLKLEQIQSNGSLFINELKNIIVSYYTARLVISGDLSLGMMLSVSYIIGQLNAPISQFMLFVYSIQDAKISLERLNEIHTKENEDKNINDTIKSIPENSDIKIENLSFRYFGSEENVLENLNFTIEKNKITAIVGASGSGKSTLLKLLLRFYEPQKGNILIGDYNLNNISQNKWRENCGIVMQEGYIFNDTIANNIALGEDIIDVKKLKQAANIANIYDFIENLSNGFNTKIGNEGLGLSGGQKQRILIARAIYKNPNILFFDEATSSLDSRNEKTIMENLNLFFQGKTAFIIAHRLSTVKNADQIIVLDNGKIIEIGNHNDLIKLKGLYFSLVQNQLDLDK